MLLGFPLAVVVEEDRIGCSAAGNITPVLSVRGGCAYDAAFDEGDKGAMATCSVDTASISSDPLVAAFGVVALSKYSSEAKSGNILCNIEPRIRCSGGMLIFVTFAFALVGSDLGGANVGDGMPDVGLVRTVPTPAECGRIWVVNDLASA